MAMLSQSEDNLNMAILLKMQSNGMPINLDLTVPRCRRRWSAARRASIKGGGGIMPAPIATPRSRGRAK